MTFNMFYGMFALLLFLHLQRVIPAAKIRKSKGGYGYGGSPVPWGPRGEMTDLLCFYCQRHPDGPCYNRFCHRGFIGYARRIGFYGWEWYNPHPHDVLCYYCWFYGNIGCGIQYGCPRWW